MKDGADRLKLKVTPAAYSAADSAAMGLTDPARLAVGTQTITAQIPVYRDDDLGFDMLIGWPQVRDNILVFDGVRRTVDAVDQVPAEACGWLQLKIFQYNRRSLYLEVPLRDGRTGRILVDSGDVSGVALPAAQWAQWESSHPFAPTTVWTYDYGLGVDSGREVLAWADEISVGPITLTHVRVHKVSEFQAMTCGGDQFAGAIGLEALGRMKMVVDAKNGVAYVKPEPPPGRDGAAGASARGDWSVGPHVRIKQSALLVDAAEYKLNAMDYDGAIAECDHALELEPTYADAYDDRGSAEADKGDYDGAIADLNRAVELDPTDVAALDDRGATRLEKGDFSGAMADLNHALDFDSQNENTHFDLAMARQVHGDFAEAIGEYDKAIQLGDDSQYTRLYRQLLLLRLGKGSSGFPEEISGWKDGWKKTMGQFVAGWISQDALLKAAEKEDSEPVMGQRCQAFYVIGMMRLVHNDPGGAGGFFQKALATGRMDFPEFMFAGAELARLDPTMKK